MISSSSRVSLKGAASKLTPPGELLSMNPKSMWIRCPASSSRMFPLWRSCPCATKVASDPSHTEEDQSVPEGNSRDP